MDTSRQAATANPAHADGRRAANFLLVREAAEIMRMDDSTLYRHLRGGRFPAVKVGGRYLVPAAVVEQMAAEALTSGQCIVVEEWADRWREERAAEALARGQTGVPRNTSDRNVGEARDPSVGGKR